MLKEWFFAVFILNVKKVTSHLWHAITGTEGKAEVYLYSFLALEEYSECHTPAALLLGKSSSTHGNGGWLSPQGQSGQIRKGENPLFPQGFEPWTIKPIGSHYTNYAIPAQPSMYKKNSSDIQ